MNFNRYLVIMGCTIALFLLSGGCTGSKQAANGSEQESKRKSTSAAAYGFQTLADYLRRDPSIKITGSGEDLVVYIRSADTISSGFQPLFVIDRNTILNTYADAARVVDVNDIQSVRVLKPIEGTAEYGIRGGNGVIVIRTKKK